MVQPNGIPLDTAAIVSTVLEGILYGFSLLMFIGTLWALMHRRMNSGVNVRMVSVACSLLIFSSAHMIIDIIRTEEGLVQQRNTFTDGPVGFFSDVAQWSFVYKNMLYMLQTLVGDGVVIYRCYVVWRSWWIIVIPALMWCSVATTGIGSVYSISQATTDAENIFAPITGPWITAFLAATLFTNVFSTSLLAYRIWAVGRRVSSASSQSSVLWPVLRIILDAGVVYSISLLAALLCFVTKNRGHYVLLDMIMPIISLTFYMVIIRITISKSASQGGAPPSSGFSNPLSMSRLTRGGREYDDQHQYPLRKMEVHITQLTETGDPDFDKADDIEVGSPGESTPTALKTPRRESAYAV
ncbi:hypothetical protein HYDPIDRAFT_89176 [Hydnomerulius pinastri MD-312]|uniref:Uncharacterized protein n=1 Tax=Hydnomerulius pinastri MD-312 TaxID=994086 RepID=A0A0C9WAU7_9AGAM|nr:hypothetical protein HYDPIDRAFT_89176 [Hydnomerulius pinastri MD-312]